MLDRSKISLAPQSPGVYIFLSAGKPIYVGKSKNIRERLKAYVDLTDSRESVPKIIEEADEVKWIITPSEEDAIFLEQRLILQNLPKYNVKIKDTRGIKYIKLNMDFEFPSVAITRILRRDSSLYFGPFNAKDARELFECVRRVFNIRSCTEQKFKMFRKAQRPCLDGQISLCPAPCAYKVDRTEYMKKVSMCSDFLRGRFKEVIKQIEERMWAESEKENFELAAKYRDQLNTLLRTLDYKRVVFEDYRASDYISVEIFGDKVGVAGVKVRDGRFFGSYGGVYRYGGQDLEELVSMVFTQLSDVSQCVSEVFETEKKIGTFVFRPPKSDEEKEILAFAKKSALEHILQMQDKDSELVRTHEEFSKFLMLQEVPKRIEVYDFSNFGGKNLVGVKVHFEFGKIVPDRIRLYKVDKYSYDDIMALKNVLERRLKDVISQKDVPAPDFILIDGGKGHYSAAKSVMNSVGLNIPFACVKKENRNTRMITLIYDGQEIKPKGKLLSFILRLRDAAHNRAKRFAVKSSTKIVSQI